MKCPFYPYCKHEEESAELMLVHIGKDHPVARGNSYGDKYFGNGHTETLEIGND